MKGCRKFTVNFLSDYLPLAFGDSIKSHGRPHEWYGQLVLCTKLWQLDHASSVVDGPTPSPKPGILSDIILRLISFDKGFAQPLISGSRTLKEGLHWI